ncbi:DoxX family protein [Bacillus kexueae]|uniref:DoxX family protein n=1 Tax=Aeribacillus kexueae TaxID=2078952 RepID=UPI001FAF7E7A|nr:DoxX family protein [Bacillus kexueae]
MTNRVEWGLFIGRLILGGTMLAHGIQKFTMMDNVVGMFTENFGLPAFVAYLTAIVETVAGLALILGLMVEVSALLLGLIMIGAIVTVKFPMAGFFGNGQMAGYELDLALLALSIILTVAGSRLFALTNLFSKRDKTTNTANI